MKSLSCLFSFVILLTLTHLSAAQTPSAAPAFWPEGKRVALSLSFDDARLSQVDVGTKLLDEYGVKATFFVLTSSVSKRLDAWKQAIVNGHEIGNHTELHPCSGNFPWAKPNALEGYTLDKMKSELVRANKAIEAQLGITPKVFAYPCGQTFVGRGVTAKSYIPLIAELFSAGRGWLDEGPNDPTFCDMAQLTGMEMDGKEFEQLLPIIENAKKTGHWVVLAGHEVGESGNQTTRVAMLRKLCEYAKNPANGVWIAPIGVVAKYVKNK
ncbi:polysaccharide deacetylase family protein [Runella slithyformis]|uniref:Polysaccharide deacetylase n=1 Tax=Runella slithyformis (strain ATCC 29530 / DSM 19594 / LMG 11500 / NCIMB 11436 / LSU 4) TaxID=761193 RepID=A0A7U4E4P0_RUNSL|nr:polysaccharide deacetylase family protein [Runella slithyformis]AEI47279.1 polysaccharide deacetylase [Runella slithyformis DSM 19594]